MKPEFCKKKFHNHILSMHMKYLNICKNLKKHFCFCVNIVSVLVSIITHHASYYCTRWL